MGAHFLEIVARILRVEGGEMMDQTAFAESVKLPSKGG
jgi:hypothetical protein